MPALALKGGTPIRSARTGWPQWPVSTKADAARLARIATGNRWSYDGLVESDFAEKFVKYLGGKYGLCVANGTVAIQLALEALGVGATDEVIVPGMTWQATAAACLDVNAIPILVDVEPDTWCIDIDAIKGALTPRTKALIVVHLYGCMPNMDAIRTLCKERNLFLIEDCAHQHGSFWKGKGAGTLGDIGTFSFQESKVMSSGEGGFVACRTKELFERLYSLRNCGRGWQDDMRNAVQSGNYRITEFQAGMLIGQLTRVDGQVKRRDRNAQFLNKRLSAISGIEPMHRRKQVTQQSYFNFAFRVDPEELGVTNDQMIAALNAELGFESYAFDRPYEPLNRCSLYKPHTKPRHRISRSYWRDIDPARFELPVATDAHGCCGIVIHHAALMGTKRDMNDIADAVEKVVENIDELRGT